MLAEQVAVVRKELADLIASREDFEDQSTKVVKAVENHINLDLTVEKRARKDLEAKMLKYAEDLVGSLRGDLEVEKKLRNEAQTTYQQTLEDILEISKNLDLETEARKQQEVNIDKHLMDEIGLLRDYWIKCDKNARLWNSPSKRSWMQSSWLLTLNWNANGACVRKWNWIMAVNSSRRSRM